MRMRKCVCACVCVCMFVGESECMLESDVRVDLRSLSLVIVQNARFTG
uniref:Uncharacterized protein n=1 Tax=Anguilla anguilla TaxID=7936 RepID=A0A0E9PD14_ANGAN